MDGGVLGAVGDGRGPPAAPLRLIGVAFILLEVCLLVRSAVALLTGHHASPGVGGFIWTAVPAVVMFPLAALKRRTGPVLGNPPLVTEGRVTFIDGLPAVAVLVAVAVLLGITLTLSSGGGGRSR